MCPACISAALWMTGGLATAGGAVALAGRTLRRRLRRRKEAPGPM